MSALPFAFMGCFPYLMKLKKVRQHMEKMYDIESDISDTEIPLSAEREQKPPRKEQKATSLFRGLSYICTNIKKD